MALTSMTGFGRAEATVGSVKAEVELGAVNRRQFDLHISLPRALAALEARVSKRIRQRILRGSITGSVKIHVAGDAGQRHVQVDHGLAGAYISGLRTTAARLKLKDDLTARSLAALPDVVQYRSVEEDVEATWPAIERALDKALAGLLAMKKTEGATLGRDISRRIGRLPRILRRIKALAPKVARHYAQALRNRVSKLGVRIGADDPQLMKEIAFFADRSDISEEVVRLESHLQQANRLMGSRGPAGRPLDFLCQELFREINTIGAKANDLELSRCVIQFKSELESIREQAQNVE